MEIALVLALMAAALVLFARESVPVDAVALSLLAVLLLAGILTPGEAFAGFSSDAVVAIAGLFVLTAGLRSAGTMDAVGGWIRARARNRPRLALALLLALVAFASAFMNNTACTAVFLPVALAVARHTGVPASRVLMPVAFASILGGSVTLIGTSTNVIVGELLPRYGQPDLGMFELLPVALPIALAGLAYLLLASPWLLPDRGDETLEQRHPMREYVTEVALRADSPLIGETLAAAELRRRWDLHLMAIVRGAEVLAPAPETRFESGDVLLVQGSVETLIGLQKSRGFEVHPEAALLPTALRATDLELAEAVVLPRSDLVGRTLDELDFRRRFGVNVIAITRSGEPQHDHLARLRIRLGDVLLLQGPGRALRRLHPVPGLMLLNTTPAPRPRRTAPWVPAAVIAGVVILAGTGLVALPGAVLVGTLALFATRCVTPQEAYAAVDWRMLVLIAGMIGYGAAMQSSGAAAYLAELLIAATGSLGPLALLAGFYVLTLVLTQPMSNQAAALVVLPLAMQVAAETGLNPRAMAVAIALAASSSFLTPLEPSCLLVYGPGRYRFWDFARLGGALTAAALLIALALIPRLWPL